MRYSICGLALLLTVLFFPATSKGAVYKVGESFVGFSASDQHGKDFTFKAGDAKFILFDTPSGSGESEQAKKGDLLAKHRALLLVNISELSGFKRKIARSRMESKPFQVLVVEDAGTAGRFPHAEGKLTVLLLDEKGVITGIEFAAPGKELLDLMTGR